MKDYHIALVGATGAVGAELLGVLERRNFPVATLRADQFGAIGRKRDSFQGRDLSRCRANARMRSKEWTSPSLVPAPKSRAQYVPQARDAGAVVIDNSPAFRMDKDVPLVIPEINGGRRRQPSRNHR